MKAFAFIILMLITNALSAQTVREMVLPWNGQRVVLNLKFAERINIVAWDKKEVSLKAEITINNGQLNHAHVMDSVINEKEIEIVTDFDEDLIPKNYWCDCKGASRYNTNDKDRGQWLCSEIFYTLYLPAGADLELETITGDIKIQNMKGGIEAETVSGTVDVIVPAHQKADVQLKTVMGRATSDPDISTLHKGLKPMLARKLEGKLNGGGKSVHLESVTGDVNLKSQ